MAAVIMGPLALGMKPGMEQNREVIGDATEIGCQMGANIPNKAPRNTYWYFVPYLRSGAGEGSRTLDLRFTKPLLCH